MNTLWTLLKFATKRQRDDSTVDSGTREPLDHPEIAHMTLAELADLPMPAYTKENCSGGIRII